jgi:hypothetical protein
MVWEEYSIFIKIFRNTNYLLGMNRKLLNESKVHTIAIGAIASETLETVAFI